VLAAILGFFLFFIWHLVLLNLATATAAGKQQQLNFAAHTRAHPQLLSATICIRWHNLVGQKPKAKINKQKKKEIRSSLGGHF